MVVIMKARRQAAHKFTSQLGLPNMQHSSSCPGVPQLSPGRRPHRQLPGADGGGCHGAARSYDYNCSQTRSQRTRTRRQPYCTTLSSLSAQTRGHSAPPRVHWAAHGRAFQMYYDLRALAGHSATAEGVER